MHTFLPFPLSSASGPPPSRVTIHGWGTVGTPHQQPKYYTVTTSSLNYSKHLHNAWAQPVQKDSLMQKHAL